MYYLGIDLGGTNIAAGIVNEKMNLIYKTSIPTEAKSGAETVIARMAEVAKLAIKGAGITEDEVKSIGIGSPGSIDPERGMVIYANNLGFFDLPMADMLGEYFPGKPIYVENDANVAAWAEAKCGAAAGVRDSVTITLGTGVGGGMVIISKLYSGFNHAGAEMGHIVIKEGGRPCTCGRKGCWEAYASVTGLIKTTQEHMQKNPDTLMWKLAGGSLDKVNGLTSFDAMRKGDEEGKKVVDEYLHSVATGLVDIINILQPEIICIGGGISKEGDYLLKPIKEYADKEMYARYNKVKTEIRIAKLGNDAGIIGAALLGA
ncbi:MAG: ROK family protein [Clostridia bacterium]|nr:ROK family protein [Clostridia bacterium]